MTRRPLTGRPLVRDLPVRFALAPAALMLGLGLAAASAPAAAADLTGTWRLNGKVESFAYVLDCQLTQSGERLSGICTDLETSDAEHRPQGSHPLTSGTVSGDRVSFAYKTHFLAIPFSVTYTGAVAGDRLSGTIAVPGRRGAFTAVRR